MTTQKIIIKNKNDKICLEIIQQLPYKFDETTNIKTELTRINVLNDGYMCLRKSISENIPDKNLKKGYIRCVSHCLSSSLNDPMIPDENSIKWDELDNFIDNDINYVLPQKIRNVMKNEIKNIWLVGIEKVKKINKQNKTEKTQVYAQQHNNIIVLSHPDHKTEMRINKNRYDHMYYAWEKNNKTKQSFELIVFCLLMRYDYLYDLSTCQLSTHPFILSTLAKSYTQDNIACELCASIINNYFEVYCSLFYDLEKHFGSIGSYRYVSPIRGLVTVGVFPAISIVKDILTHDWFNDVPTDNNLTIYIKLQGGWGKINDLLRLKNNKIITNFYKLKIDKNLKNYDDNMIEMRNERYGKDDLIDTYIDQIMMNPYLTHHSLIDSQNYRWVDYIKNQSYCNNDVAIYILSNTKINNPDISNLKYPNNDTFIFQQYRDKSQQKTAEYVINWLSKKHDIANI
jgi:hypothetical protein